MKRFRVGTAAAVVAVGALAGSAHAAEPRATSARAHAVPARPAHAAAARARTPHAFAPPGTGGAPAGLPGGYPFWALQLNLCNSGIASCYDGGKSIPEAAGVIQQWEPDLVTLNEVCRDDVRDVLFPAMQQVWAGSQVFWAFAPALNEATGNSPYLCTNGDQYGIGLIGHFVGGTGTVTTSIGHYPDEDGGIETRAWLCVHAGTQYDACTTHLSKMGDTAILQCGYLMDTVIPGFRVNAEMIVAGDLNLKYGSSPNAQDCVPPGWFRKGDGSVQHVLATSNVRFDFSQKIGLVHTDHPGWLVAVDAPWAPEPPATEPGPANPAGPAPYHRSVVPATVR